MSEESMASQPVRRVSRRHVLLVMVLAVLFVTIPFLFWRETWFGRKLTNDEIAQYLRDDQHPRKIQHALTQISGRMAQGDSTLEPVYPQIVRLARHPLAQVRTMTAWVMGQDNNSEAFHHALLALLEDPEVMVRRNAALSLVRFRDARGRPELVEMLHPYSVRAPEQGRASIPLEAGQGVVSGTLLARITPDHGRDVEIRSPFSGHVSRVLIRDGSRVAAGENLVAVSPDSDQVWEGLRALYLLGQPEDLADVERYGRGVTGMPDRIRQQAALTAEAIRTRAERNPTR